MSPIELYFYSVEFSSEYKKRLHMLAFFQMVMWFWCSNSLSKRFKSLERGVPEVFVTRNPSGLFKNV